MKGPRVLIVGWDGATWSVLEPLLAAGRLPTLAALRGRGAWGALKSTMPPVTAPAWSTFMTGMEPARHGLLSWQLPMDANGQRRWISARDLAAPTLWRRLSEAGRRVAVVNVPITYPPEAVNGCLVSGMLTPSARSPFTYPPDLRDVLLAAVPDYAPDVEMQETERDIRTADGIARFLEEVRTSIHHREAALEVVWQRGPFDLVCLMFEAPDRLQHPLWQYAVGVPAAASAPADASWEARHEAVVACYAELDAALARLVARCDEDTTVFLLSDHGFGPLRVILHLNDWLASKGWLRYAGGRASARAALRRLLRPLRRWLPSSWTRQGRVAFAPLRMLDWSRTRAYAGLPTEDGIWLNVRGREPWGVVEPGAEYESLRDEVIASVGELRHPGTGEPLILHAWRREEVHRGPYAARAPDIVLELAPGVKVTPAVGQGGVVEDVAWQGRGHHRREGILVAAGPSIRPGPVAGARLAGVAPTVLALLGLAIPAEMDGGVMEGLLAVSAEGPASESGGASASAEAERASGYTDEEAAQVAARLKALGYLE